MNISSVIVIVLVGYCQSLPELQYDGSFTLSNNSFYLYQDIGIENSALKCVTDNETCCNDTNDGNWIDHEGRPVQQGEDGSSCLYVTRGEKEIILNRRGGCISPSSGIWRCDIPVSSGEIQSLYIYLSNSNPRSSPPYQGQLNPSVLLNFTLHLDRTTEIVPEFTVSCLTHGGPATTVQWTVNGVSVEEDRDHEISQIILDTSHNSVYDNRLKVRGWRYGTYNCSISNNIKDLLPKTNTTKANCSKFITVSEKPHFHGITIKTSNTAHYGISIVLSSNATVTGYIIYYQSKGGPVNGVVVSGGETETHSLDGLQRGLTYNISIVALSDHLPSPPIGPIIVSVPLVVVETSPESLNVIANTQFSITCTARAEIDRERVPQQMTLEWIHILPSSISYTVPPSLYTTTGSPERGYQSVLTTSENDTRGIFRCITNYSDYSTFSDTNILIEDMEVAPRPTGSPLIVLLNPPSVPSYSISMTYNVSTRAVPSMTSTSIVQLTPSPILIDVTSSSEDYTIVVVCGVISAGLLLLIAILVLLITSLLVWKKREEKRENKMNYSLEEKRFETSVFTPVGSARL